MVVVVQNLLVILCRQHTNEGSFSAITLVFYGSNGDSRNPLPKHSPGAVL